MTEHELSPERLRSPEYNEEFARHVEMIQDFLTYARNTNEENTHGLLPYQLPAFKATQDFFENHLRQLKPGDDLTIAGYLDLPMSFGKTFMQAKIAEGFGVGKETMGRRRRALVLVPTVTGSNQIVGDVAKGFTRDLPSATCQVYQGSSPSAAAALESDVVVMTYTAFLWFIEDVAAGKVADPNFDLVLCDEAHHSVGNKISAVLNAYRQGKIAIGLTATPEYSDKHAVKNIFETCIHQTEMRPLIESGVLNGVQLLGLRPNTTLTALGTAKDFTEQELIGLRTDRLRNAAIIEIALQLMAEGRRGVINAIAGNDCEHARQLATLLDGYQITRRDGTLHTVRAAAIGDFMSVKDRERILRQYALGEIDVITQVLALNESWDEDEVNFIINAAPTTSRVRATQRIGRGLRCSKRWPITVVVELLDAVVGNKLPFTAWHVFGEEEFSQNKIITTEERRKAIVRKDKRRRALAKTALGSNKPNRPETDDSPLIFDHHELRSDLLAMAESYELQMTGVLVIDKQKQLGPPKPGWVPLVGVLRVLRERGLDIGLYAARTAVMHEGGFECELTTGRGGGEYYVQPGALAFAATYEPREIAPEGWNCTADFVRNYNTTHLVVDAIIERLRTEGAVKGSKDYRGRLAKRTLEHFSPAESVKINKAIEARVALIPPEETDDVLLRDLAASVGQRRNAVQFFLARHHGVTGRPAVSPDTNRPTTIFTKQEADIAKFHYSHQEVTGSGVVLLDELERRSGVAEAEIRRASTTPEFAGLLLPGRYPDAQGNYHYTLFCAQEKAEETVYKLRQLQIKEVVVDRQPAVAEGPVHARRVSETLFDLKTLLQELRCSPHAVRYLLRQVPFENQGIVRSDGVNGGQPAIHHEAASILRRRCRELSPPATASRSDYYFVRRYNCPLREVHIIAQSFTPAPNQVGLHRDAEANIITFFYTKELQRSIDSVLREKYGARLAPEA